MIGGFTNVDAVKKKRAAVIGYMELSFFKWTSAAEIFVHTIEFHPRAYEHKITCSQVNYLRKHLHPGDPCIATL